MNISNVKIDNIGRRRKQKEQEADQEQDVNAETQNQCTSPRGSEDFANKYEHSILTEITQIIESNCNIQSLKLSDLNLNDPEVTKNLGELLVNTYPIQYLNLASSNLQLQDLVKISSELKTK